MSGGLIDKVYIGLDNAPAAFDIKGRIHGPNGTNLDYIRSETGVVAVLKSDKLEPLHLALHHTRSEALTAARSLAQNLIETIRAELAQWSAAQAGGPPPALNVPPPTLTTTSAPPPLPPVATAALSTPATLTSTAHQSVMPPVVSVAPATTPLMTVRQPTVLQLLPQQQYVLNQENGQLIPIVQPGVQVSNPNFTSFAQPLGLQQPNFSGTQIVDISSMQPVNVTQLRLSGVPSSMSMILPNGLTFPQASLTSSDTTTVSSATSTPVVCAAQSTNSSQKILYSTDKGDKDIKYHIQGTDGVQWTVPGSQTMLIPYQQLQDLTSSQQGLTNLQPQQFVSIAPAGGLPQTSLPLTAAQLQHLQATGTIMQLNQKPIVSSGSLINIISTGQASSPQILSNTTTPTKNLGSQESRGQKRLSDGSPSQLQLRPIAPAGSHVSQDKGSVRDSRSWTTAAARDNTVVSMGMKINPAHGTIIHVSSGQQTNVSASGMTQEATGMYIRQIDRNAIQIQASKETQKQDLAGNKLQSTAQNVQMITVPQGMTVLQNPLNISQMPTVLGQPNSQVYMIPANHPNIVQGGLPPGLIGQQVLQPGQNVTVMQPNHLGMPGGVQYNVPLMPMNMQANSQYMSGINLNTQLSAQQLNAAFAGQLASPNLSGSIPIVQAPQSSPMANTQTIPVTQPPPIHQIVPQNSFITPTSQYAGIPQQYMMQGNNGSIVPSNPNVQYSITNNQANNSANNGQSVTSESDSTNGATNQTNYITSSQDNGYSMSGSSVQNPGQQNFTDGSSAPTTGFTPPNQTVTPSYGSSNGSQNPAYNVSQATTSQPPPSYPTNGSNLQTTNQNYGPGTTSSQNTAQTFSPSTTPAPNQTYQTTNLPNMPNVTYPPNQTPQNPYPNATGQNLAAYASNQYQYTSRPWFRPRYGSPQGSPYSSGAGPPPNGPPMPVPPPTEVLWFATSFCKTMNTENRYPVTASLFMLKEIKHRQEQVSKGYQLLRRKAEALRIKGRHATAELAATQAILDHTLREAYISLAAIKFTNGESNALVLENVGQAQVRVQRITENISGVTMESLQAVEVTGASDVLQYAGLGAGGHRTGETKKAFRETVHILIKFASLRNTCILLDEALRITLRKVNGIEKVIMPKLLNTVTYILMEMDEREREDFHRLKMVKAKKIRNRALINLKQIKNHGGGGESDDFLNTRASARVCSIECLTNLLCPRTSLSSTTDSAGDFKPICYPHNWDDDDLLF